MNAFNQIKILNSYKVNDINQERTKLDKNIVKMTENTKYSKSSYKLTRKRQHNRENLAKDTWVIHITNLKKTIYKKKFKLCSTQKMQIKVAMSSHSVHIRLVNIKKNN